MIGRIRFSVRNRSTTSLAYCCQPLRVGRIARAGRYSDYASTMSWSDCRSALPPPCLCGLLETFRGFAPAEAARLSQVPCQTVEGPATDLDPGPASPTRFLRWQRCWLPGFETLGPAAFILISGLNTFTCVVADPSPSLQLHLIRYLLKCGVPFRPGSYPLVGLDCPTDLTQLILAHSNLKNVTFFWVNRAHCTPRWLIDCT